VVKPLENQTSLIVIQENLLDSEGSSSSEFVDAWQVEVEK